MNTNLLSSSQQGNPCLVKQPCQPFSNRKTLFFNQYQAHHRSRLGTPFPRHRNKEHCLSLKKIFFKKKQQNFIYSYDKAAVKSFYFIF